MQRVTVRVELGNHVLRGRQVESLEVAQAVGDHARCTLAFDRDPRVPGSVKDLRLGDLADARVRVVFLVDADDGTGADGTECLAFEGQVRHADARYQPTGVARFAVTALSASYALAEHVDRAYRREHTVDQLVVALGAHVAGDLPTGPARDYVQPGRSAWATLAEVAAGEGLQLRPAWGRSPDAAAAPTPVEVGAGFADVTHTLVWGRDLLGFTTSVAPANAGVTGAFYDPAAKHDHRYVVRTEPTWLGGAAPVVSAARRAADLDAGGGEPGHVEVGGPGGGRARSLAEFRGRLERESARRLGAAVVASGSSAVPALRAGDKIDLWTSAAAAAGTLDADGRDAAAGDADGAAPADGGPASPGAWVNGPEDADRTGVFGLIAVTHRWYGGLYENQFTATPWAEYAPRPAAVAAGYGAQGGGPTAGDVALALVVENADPKHQGRVRVRYPWMSDGTRTAWVRVAAPGAGNGRGLGWLPSVGDEVVVAAVAGDPEHPVVLGALWNGVDRAAHHPGRTHLVTPSGNTLALTEGPAGAGRETVELHTAGGKTGVQLSGNGGSPVVTVYSDGDLSLEAPKGQVRITAKSMLTHVAEDARREVRGVLADEVGGEHVTHVRGRLALVSDGHVDVAGQTMTTHAPGGHTLVAEPAAHNPGGGPAPTAHTAVPAAAATLWGARPVPGPGPGVSTEAPRSRTRREVAQAAAAAAPAAVTAVPTSARVELKAGLNSTKPNPCSGQGLATEQGALEFASGMRTLQNAWPKLDANARRVRMQAALNAQLSKSGVPPVTLITSPFAGGRVGQLISRDWVLDVDERLFEPATLTDENAEKLAKTAYHEARHAEQYFLIARRRAALGESSKAVFAAVPIPMSIVQAAGKSPLPTATPAITAGSGRDSATTSLDALAVCAATMDSSYVGAGAGARNATLVELQSARTAVDAATDHANEVAAQSGPGSRQYADAYRAFQRADQHYKVAYSSYRDLPEEADAWAAEALVHDGMIRASTLRRFLFVP